MTKGESQGALASYSPDSILVTQVWLLFGMIHHEQTALEKVYRWWK